MTGPCNFLLNEEPDRDVLSQHYHTLSIEALTLRSIKIRSTQEVEHIVNITYHELALYADDLLLFLDNVPQSLPAVINIIPV